MKKKKQIYSEETMIKNYWSDIELEKKKHLMDRIPEKYKINNDIDIIKIELNKSAHKVRDIKRLLVLCEQMDIIDLSSLYEGEKYKKFTNWEWTGYDAAYSEMRDIIEKYNLIK